MNRILTRSCARITVVSITFIAVVHEMMYSTSAFVINSTKSSRKMCLHRRRLNSGSTKSREFLFVRSMKPSTSLSKVHLVLDDLSTASLSLAGKDPDSAGKVNQDACFHFHAYENRFFCCGVLDGHGKKGHELNSFLQSFLPKCLEEKLMLVESSGMGIDKVLVESFEESHYAARMDTNVPAGRSGTTCVVTILDTNTATLYTGNVGDSRAIVGVQKLNEDGSSDSQWGVKALSQETTTTREEERKRIQEGEGRIDSGGNVW